MKWLLETSARIWQYLRDLATVLRPCRFSAIVVAAGAALLLSAQGLEFTVRLPAEGLGKVLWFWVCVFLWSFQSWYWARLMLDLTFGDRNAPRRTRNSRDCRRSSSTRRASWLRAVISLLSPDVCWRDGGPCG